MAQERSSQQLVNVSEKTERERLVIAKEVVIKTLVPAVFQNVGEEKREKVFDKWYQKLLVLIAGGENGSLFVTKDELQGVLSEVVKQVEKKAEKKAEPLQEAQPKRRKMMKKSFSEDSITEKQMKKIFAVARSLGYSKADIEKKLNKRLSLLTKREASRIIEDLEREEGLAVLYG